MVEDSNYGSFDITGPEIDYGSFDGEDSVGGAVKSTMSSVEQEEKEKELSIAFTGKQLEPGELKAAVNLSENRFRDLLFTDPEQAIVGLGDRFSYYEDIVRKNQEIQSTPVLTEEDILAATNNNISSRELQVLRKRAIAQEIASKKFKEADVDDRSIAGKIWDFADFYLTRSFLTGIEDVAAVETTRGRNYLDMLADPNVSVEEFARYVESNFEKARSEGVLTSDNVFALAREMSALQDLGYNKGELSDRIFGGIDVATSLVTLGLGKFAVATARAGKATNVLSKAVAISGKEVGEEVAENVLRHGPNPPVASTAGPSLLDVKKGEPKPGVRIVQILNRETEIIKQIIADTAKSAIGKLVDEPALRAKAVETAQSIIAKSSRPIHDWEIVTDGLGNYWNKLQIGTAKEGKAFKPIYRNAEDEISMTPREGFNPEVPGYVADKAKEIDAQVVPVDAADLSKGFIIERMDNIDISDIVKVSDIKKTDAILNAAKRTVVEQIGRISNNPLFGTPYLRDASGYDALAKMAEGYRGRIKDLADKNLKSITRLNNKEVKRLESITRRLRDGDDAHVREWHTEADFKDRYYDMFGESPSAKELEAYRALVDLSDTSYVLKSSMVLNRYIRAGYKNAIEVDPGTYVAAKRVERASVKDDDLIYRPDRPEVVDKSMIDENVPLWELFDAHPSGAKYVADTPNVRDLRPGDIYGYNAGGNRVNGKTRWFVMLTAEGFRPSAMLSAFSIKQADKAVLELNAIRAAYKSSAGNIDEVIARNSTWSGGTVTNKAEFDTFLQENGIVKFGEESGNFSRKRRDEPLLLSKEQGNDVWQGTNTYDYVEADRRRSDKPLMEFGGGTAAVDSPLSAIAQDFGGAAYAYSNSVYTTRAMKDWVDTARKVAPNSLKDNIPSWDFERLFRSAEIVGSTPEERRLQELKSILERRMGHKDKISITMERTLGDIAEFVFDKTGWRSRLGDPADNLLKLGFQSSFGFFSPIQAFIQGSGALNAIAISPTQGLRAASMSLSLRAVLRSPDEATRALAIQRFAKAHNMTVDEATELVDSLVISGRLNTSGESAEAGLGPSYMVASSKETNDVRSTFVQDRIRDAKKYGGAALDVGLIPFNAGERFARLVSHTTAFLEWKAKNPGKSAFSEDARAAITERDHVLSLHMTTTSRPMIQSGFMKVPTQWLSFSFRALEAVTVGRGLTKLERARLAFILGPFYGMTGIGITGMLADEAAMAVGAEAGGEREALIRNGVLDALSVWAGGPEGAFSVGPRMAAVGALLEQWRKITQEQTPQTLFGPSGEIVGGAAVQLFNSLSHVWNGRPIAATESLLATSRRVSGINQKFNMLGILYNGRYTSRTGDVIQEDMEKISGVFAGLGVTPYTIQTLYSQTSAMYMSEPEIRKARKWAMSQNTKAYDLILSGNESDYQRGVEMLEEVGTYLDSLPISPAERQRLGVATLKGLDSKINDLIKMAYRHQDTQSVAWKLDSLQKNIKGNK